MEGNSVSTNQVEKEIRLAIAHIGGQKQLALTLQISEPELSRKLNNDRGWTLEEISGLFAILGLKVVPVEEQDDRLLTKLLSKKVSELL